MSGESFIEQIAGSSWDPWASVPLSAHVRCHHGASGVRSSDLEWRAPSLEACRRLIYARLAFPVGTQPRGRATAVDSSGGARACAARAAPPAAELKGRGRRKPARKSLCHWSAAKSSDALIFRDTGKARGETGRRSAPLHDVVRVTDSGREQRALHRAGFSKGTFSALRLHQGRAEGVTRKRRPAEDYRKTEIPAVAAATSFRKIALLASVPLRHGPAAGLGGDMRSGGQRRQHNLLREAAARLRGEGVAQHVVSRTARPTTASAWPASQTSRPWPVRRGFC